MSASNNVGSGFRPPPPQPNYSSSQVQGALAYLASIDPIELCNEAKIECCRAIRDLRSCGRNVQSVLITCHHASLCEECSQRSDVCPICRVPLPKDGRRLRLRLYYECIEAGLISKRCDDRFQDKEDSEQQIVPDVQRLYSLFDAALDNNLSSLICHYVTDVCMDESAVSSDPVVAFLLDEVVVKDWCKQTFRNMLTDLQAIYRTAEDMNGCLDSLLKLSVKLDGLSNVLEILESSFKDSLAAKLHDLHCLQESILKTKQHMEIMMWGLRHNFLENVVPKYLDFASWRSAVRQRKSAAEKRAWPGFINRATETSVEQSSTLFIEDALSNLESEQGLTGDDVEGYQVESLKKEGSPSFVGSKIEGMAKYYPFENLRAAIDVLFLLGSSELVVAKQATLLYYLFDRHWSIRNEEWRDIIDDFAATFSVSRHALLESLTFYLLDDDTDEAMQEACHLLPEIASPTIHPKVAQVLLERQNPDAALMVLRWSGRDGGQLVSLGEAITAVRVRVECGLLTEAFMYQRMVCKKVKEKKLLRNAAADAIDDCWKWTHWVEALVTEICCLCIRRSLVDRMIELPWNSDEEKHIHRCLLDFAMEDPSTVFGSLLVVFYLQRYRYTEAYQVNQKIQSVEQESVAQGSAGEECLARMRLIGDWRAGLVEKGIALLPDVLQQKVKSGNFSEEVGSPGDEYGAGEILETVMEEKEENILTGFMVPPVDASQVLGADRGVSSLKPSLPETPMPTGRSLNISNFKDLSFGASTPATFFNNADSGLRTTSALNRNFKFDTTPVINEFGYPSTSQLRDFDRSSSRVPRKSQLRSYHANKVSPGVEYGILSQLRGPSPHHSGAVNHITSATSKQRTSRMLAQDAQNNLPTKTSFLERYDRSDTNPVDDRMDISWSNEKQFPVEDAHSNGLPRWRSDEISDDEDFQIPDSSRIFAAHKRHARGIHRSRFR